MMNLQSMDYFQAFGWIGQGFWRGEKENVPPTPSQIEAVKEFLLAKGLKQADLKKVVTKFPEVLACDVDSQLESNAKELEDKWFMKGPAVTGVIKRRPEVLGYNVDCNLTTGACVGECNRCWARF